LEDCDDVPVTPPLASVEELLEAERLDGPAPLVMELDEDLLVPVVTMVALPIVATE